MKEAENNEISLLLRNLGKGQRSESGSGPTRVGVQGEPVTRHLDADELSSFAEGVLPAATRALYAGHLADCDRCRSIVAKLALASGPAVQTKTEKVVGFSLWHFLGGIFNPRVMRIAVPVMSVVIIAAIAFVWLRRENRELSVAQMSKPVTTEPGFVAGDVKQNEQPQESGAGPSNRATAGKNVQGETRPVDSPGVAGRAKVDQEAATSDSPAKPKEVAKTVAEAETTSRVAAAAPPPAANEAQSKSRSRERDDADKNAAQPTATDAVAKSEDTKREEKSKKAADDKEVRRASSSPFGGFSAGRLLKDDRQAETKSVGGRRFSRQDNRWVDTEYKPSAPLTNVARGSEQYRALIGDEPGLRTIAEQLEGEVIVVWKGKAYRIR